MDNVSYRNNRPASRVNEITPPAQSPQVNAQARAKHSLPPRRSKKRLFIAGAIVTAVLLILAGLFVVYRGIGAGSAIDSSKYQAVFFTNGQVYFGKLSRQSDEYMKLTNVYYLQSKTSSNDQTTPQSAAKQNSSDVELIKLGNEIHGPEDEMLIAKDQILFFENLKPQGTVSKTITNYQKK